MKWERGKGKGEREEDRSEKRRKGGGENWKSRVILSLFLRDRGERKLTEGGKGGRDRSSSRLLFSSLLFSSPLLSPPRASVQFDTDSLSFFLSFSATTTLRDVASVPFIFSLLLLVFKLRFDFELRRFDL